MNKIENDPLTREICIRILEYLGVLPYSNFGNTGISLDEHRLPLELGVMVEYEDCEKITHPIYIAKTEEIDLDLRLLLLDLSIHKNEYVEFYLLFKVNDMPLHCLHYIDHQKEISSTIELFYEEKNVWLPSDIKSIASNLIGFDTLFSFGVLWKPECQYEDLRESVLGLLSKNG